MKIFLTENISDNNMFTLDKDGVYHYFINRIPFFRNSVTDESVTREKSAVHINFKKIIRLNNDRHFTFNENLNHIDLIVNIVVNQNIEQFHIEVTPISQLHGENVNTYKEQARYSKLSSSIKDYLKMYYTYPDGNPNIDGVFNQINKIFYMFEEKFNLEPAYK